MKWQIIFFLSVLLFISSYFFREKHRALPQSQTTDNSRPTENNKKQDASKLKNPQKQLIEKGANNIKSFISRRPKTNGNEEPGDQHEPAAYTLPVNDPRHVALADSQGNLYPNNLGVDDEYVIAYGDVIVGESRFIKEYESGDKTVNVPKPEIWPNGIIPYKIGPKITEKQKAFIELIANTLKEKDVVELRPYDPKKDKAYVHFKQGSSHCYAQVGYTGAVTQVALNEKCGEPEIFHEVFHVMGFFHEQNRFDRNHFVKILWENIDEKYWPQFERFPEESFPEVFLDPNRMPFSYNTFMLYGPRVFSTNGDYSIVNIYGEPYPAQKYPTEEDFRRARLLYEKPANSW
jgi:hypothetical protein